MKFFAAVLAAVLPLAALAAPPLKLQPGMPHYFEHFDPAMKPWHPGQDLNIEEVFKNYVYYEIIVDQSGREITVNRYIQNRKERTDHYLVRPDGALELK